MLYQAKYYPNLTELNGISDVTMKNHVALYQGYVKNTNKIMNSLQRMLAEGRSGTIEYAELKRRFGWEFDGMRLHEYYFENLGAKNPASSQFLSVINRQFGSYEAWEKDFRATGLMRGIGWVVLYQDVTNGKLFNYWINEHDTGHPAGGLPLLVMDVWEHAYLLDYGIKRADYVAAFFRNINWAVVEARLTE